MNSFPNTIIKHSDGTSKTLVPDFIITSRDFERNIMGDYTQTASFCFDNCTSNSDNALEAKSKVKLLKYKELADNENMDFAPVVTGTCGDCYDSFGLVKILAHGKKQLHINREVHSSNEETADAINKYYSQTVYMYRSLIQSLQFNLSVCHFPNILELQTKEIHMER